jgi:hypothetical protein
MNTSTGTGTRRNRFAVAAFILAAALSALLVGATGKEAKAQVIIEPIGGNNCVDTYDCDQCFRVMRAGYASCKYDWKTRCFRMEGICACIGKGCSDYFRPFF